MHRAMVTSSGHTRSPSRFGFLWAYNDYVPMTDPVPIYCPHPTGRVRPFGAPHRVVGRSAAISVSRRCHKSPRLQWAAVDVPGQFVARHAVLRAPVDTCKRPESTSQAEYAGSIPVIGSTNPQVSDAAPGPHHGARRCGRVAWRCGHRVGGGVRLDGFVAVVPEMPP